MEEKEFPHELVEKEMVIYVDTYGEAYARRCRKVIEQMSEEMTLMREDIQYRIVEGSGATLKLDDLIKVAAEVPREAPLDGGRFPGQSHRRFPVPNKKAKR